MDLPKLVCNGCTKCCIKDRVPLYPDELDKFPHQDAPPSFAKKGIYHILKLNPKTGSCVNLGPSGCKVFPNVPRSCKTYDCRVAAFTVSRMSEIDIQSRLQNPNMKAAITEGATRMKKDSPELYEQMNQLTKNIN